MSAIVTFFVAAALAGLAAFQGPINAQLASRTGVAAANVLSNVVGTAALLVLMAAMEPGAFRLAYWRDRLSDGALPWPLWMGGLLGSLYMITMVMVVPRLGTAGWILTALAGQLAASIAIDMSGWFGLARHTVSWQQVVGLVLVFLGAAVFLLPRPNL